MKERYLGDGLYASFDGLVIILRAPRLEGDHWVGLEPDVYKALQNFVQQVKQEASDANKRSNDR